jgi:hypothetical protein
MRKLWLLPCVALSLWAADVTGKWSGAIEVDDTSSGSIINTPVKAEFNQQAAEISGKIGRKEDEQCEPIRNARLEGNVFMFEVRTPEIPGTFKFNLQLVSPDRIEGQMKGAIDSSDITGKVLLTRESGKDEGKRSAISSSPAPLAIAGTPLPRK